MQKLSKVNLSDGRFLTARDVAPIIGMAALWISLFKQLLYPVLFAYYRTGDEGALPAQAAYSIALVIALFALLVAHERLSTFLNTRRWMIVMLGVAGAFGIALRSPIGLPVQGDALVLCLGGVLSALYVPVHFAYWTLYAKASVGADTTRTVVASFALFLMLYGALTLAGANTVAVSIACPLASAAMALACPQLESSHEKNAATDVSTAAPPEHESEPKPAAAAPEPTLAPSPSPEKMPPELPDGFADAFNLSEREAELAAYAHRNLNARRIASELFIAESTVYTHLKRIYRKTDVHSRHELIELIDSWEPAT